MNGMSALPEPADAVARAFWVTAVGQGQIKTEPLQPPSRDQLLVRTLFSGISRGTEALVFNGRVPVSEYQRMRAPFQSGNFPAPVKYGYANVGVVEQGPSEYVEQPVFTLFPHQTRFVVGVNDVHLIPRDVPLPRAVLAANMETALNGIWDGNPQAGTRILVIGAGTVGCLVAWLAAKTPGTSVELADVNPARAGIAGALGVRFVAPADAADDADLVFHASGTADGLNLAIARCGFEATVIELSWYGDGRVAIDLGGAFHARRLTIRSSQVGTVAASQRARYSHRRRMEVAMSLLAHPELDAVITGDSDFEELPAVMARLAAGPGDTLCHRIRYS